MSSQVTNWQSHLWQGSAGEFHSLDLGYERSLWGCIASRPALILGSAQRESNIDQPLATSKSIEVVRRRSGGGIVYVHPQDSIWIDVTIPRDDVLWTQDVSSSMLWLGKVFVTALDPWLETQMYEEEFSAGQDGRLVCFASTSPGEVFVGQSKVVGISQRRTRLGARFQCVFYRQWNPTDWTDCLVLPDIIERVSGLPVATVDVEPTEIMDSLKTVLNSLSNVAQ